MVSSGVIANPEPRLSALPQPTEAERHKILVEFNDTTTDYSKNQPIQQLFENQARRTPDAVAVVCGDKHLTYRQLNHHANQLAHLLIKHNVGAELMVGLCVERSLEMIIGLLGILKAGGTYVPLDPLYPKERLAFMLQDTQAPILLTKSHLLSRLPEHAAMVICLDRAKEMMGENPENPPCRATAEQLAYVLYTSGSTGRPKGVCIPHRGVVRLVENTNYIAVSPDDVFLQFAPLAFDASTFEIWACLLNGARLVIFPPHNPTLAELGRALQHYRVTVLWLTAGLFHQMVDEQLESLQNVKQLLAGGDVLSVSHAKKVLQHLHGGRLINGYGPTENTTFTCCYVMTAPNQIDRTVPIGRPVANTQVYILDQSGQPVPVGVCGALYTGGDGLARHYLNQPQLTAERFIENPFSDQPGARLYKTGDQARYLPDGNVEFLGRLDRQIKIRGFRIELGEIETVLSQHPDIRQAAITVREDTPTYKRLVAYVVAKRTTDDFIIELREFLREQLPEYMLPSAFVWLDALPLTPNGKVDYRALPMPMPPEFVKQQPSFLAPRDSLELRLAKLWERILNIEPIGVQDDFFDCGGNSLLAMSLIPHVEQIFGKALPLSLLYQAPTVEQLANALRQQGWSVSPSLLVPLQPHGSRAPFVCAHGTGMANLKQYVDPDQPLFALLAHGNDGRRASTTVEKSASDYLREIRAFQPSGPYFLGGFSAGGLIAFEMAQQLCRQGQEVALLVLFDPDKPQIEKCTTSVKPGRSLPMGKLATFISRHWSNLRRRDFHGKGSYVLERIGGWLNRIEISIYLNIGCLLPHRLRQFYAFNVASKIILNYKTSAYPNHVILIKTGIPSTDWQAVWESLAAGGLEIYYSTGEHSEIFDEPHCQSWAEQFASSLRKAHDIGLGRDASYSASYHSLKLDQQPGGVPAAQLHQRCSDIDCRPQKHNDHDHHAARSKRLYSW
jgi:amino acid adenylation domain-containing protein